MRKHLAVIAVASLLGGVSASAQDAAEAAAEAVTRAAEEAAHAAEGAAAATIAPPAPPPIEIRAATTAEEATEPHRFDRYVTPLDYGSVRPTAADYPVDAWQADLEGRVEYRLAVNADGKPTSCEVLQSSGHMSLDEASCAIVMERGQFNPARDEDGEATDGTYEDVHIWRKREPEFPGTFNIHVAFTVDATGKSSDCEVIDISGEVSEQMRRTFEREPCPGMNRPARAPYRDEDGNPIARRVELVLSVTVDGPPE
ncbi:MAG: energy transducer TonB [Erythrobacter sp.]|nr:energy transducer TonB [Erythrobacter sp.]